ncbi:MAG: hypothetical protein R6U17_04040 [Thermoplasmata archaeon]
MSFFSILAICHENDGVKMAFRNLKDEKILLIASYRERYTSDALDEIENIIREEEPDKVIISKVIKENIEPTIFKAMVGKREREVLNKELTEGKKRQADEISSDLIALVRSMRIPSEVHLRKGGEISKEIIEESQKCKVNKVIIHKQKKNGFERLIDKSVALSVKKELPEKSVITVE